MTMQYPSVEVQIANAVRESEMLGEGLSRYHEQNAKALQHGKLNQVEMQLVRKLIVDVANGIVDHVAEVDRLREERGGRGRNADYIGVLRQVDPEEAAYVTLTNALQGTTARARQAQTMFIAIGKGIEDLVYEAGFMKFAKSKREFKKAVDALNRITKDKYEHEKAWVIKNWLKDRGYNPPEWSDETCWHLGRALVSIMQETTEIFDRIDSDDPKNTVVEFHLNEQGRMLVDQMHIQNELLTPKFMPMLEPPRDWVAFDTGAYHNPQLSRRCKLVSTKYKDHEEALRSAIGEGSMRECLDAVNSMQSVGLKINELVFGVLKQCMDEGVEIGKLPSSYVYKRPEKPNSDDPIVLKQWRREDREARRKAGDLASEWVAIKQDMAVAERYLGNTFYLPCKLDFRGRTYCVSNFNHQKSDHTRALFVFSNGKPVGPSGGKWLAIQAANAYDAKTPDSFKKMSKRSFERRIQWTEENSEMILKCAADPMGNIAFWGDADAPFNFLAMCFEWAGFKMYGEQYVSHMPIGLDGSNSGLQHFSMALRDEVAGKLVCLTVEDEPEDVYQHVANICRGWVDADLLSEDSDLVNLASMWKQHGLGRSDVKRCVMTFVYSSKEKGFGNHLYVDIMIDLQKEYERHGVIHPFGDRESQKAACKYLAHLIWNAVCELLPKAAQAMEFLKVCATELAHLKKDLKWRSPTGFPVWNMYREFNTVRLQGTLFNRQYDTGMIAVADEETGYRRFTSKLNTTPTSVVRKEKAGNAVSPNVIHSFDAAHLHKTVNAAVREGYTDLLLIHDSFATLAADTDRFQQIIKEQFVDMYSGDIFRAFMEGVIDQAPPESREALRNKLQGLLPEAGNLDPQEVLRSRYAFA